MKRFLTIIVLAASVAALGQKPEQYAVVKLSEDGKISMLGALESFTSAKNLASADYGKEYLFSLSVSKSREQNNLGGNCSYQYSVKLTVPNRAALIKVSFASAVNNADIRPIVVSSYFAVQNKSIDFKVGEKAFSFAAPKDAKLSDSCVISMEHKGSDMLPYLIVQVIYDLDKKQPSNGAYLVWI
jgi:hypothetical protein